MTRDQFREGVFARDGRRCVVCKAPAQDAHHILERRLWPDGGYHLDNGASLCGPHHVRAEMTTLSCEAIRECAGIAAVLLPPHLYRDQQYDKWGNPVLPNGTRLKGDLFFDESVQKILSEGGVLSLFNDHVKYPRTYHLPWSPGRTKDDRTWEDDEPFRGKRVVATLKMDGENTSIYRDGVHARSLAYEPRVDRNWMKVLQSKVGHELPESWRLCGENLTAVHSIRYENLPAYFMLFSVWSERNVCQSWDETKFWAEALDIPLVPVLFEGEYDREEIESRFVPVSGHHEGYVVRLADTFTYGDFRRSVAKYVRAGHVADSHQHWTRRMVEFNGLVGN